MIATAVAVLTVLNYMIIPVSAAEGDMTWEDIRTAVNSATGATTITLTNDIDVAIDEEVIEIGGGKKITLDLNGKTIRRISDSANHTNEGFFDVIDSNTEFTLKDSSGSDSGKLTGAYAENSTACIYVGENAKFIMDGGTISDNTAYTGDGAAVYIYRSGSFTMNGGIIENNNALRVNNNNGRGAAVYMYSYYGTGGTFIMNGGTISNNGGDSTYAGGAVYVNSYCTFTMNDGTISGNTATQGGGVFIADSTSAVMNLKGGNIIGNTGSGVYIASRNSKLNVGGNKVITVTGNKDSSGNESNVYFYNVRDNSTRTTLITVNSAIQSGSQIGIRLNNTTYTNVTTTSGYNNYNRGIDPNTIFIDDCGTYYIDLTGNEVHYRRCNPHNWGQATYDWFEEDGEWKCTATRVCSRNATHIETETVVAALQVSTPATCEGTGAATATATFTNAAFTRQTKNVVLSALGHNWMTFNYVWAEDYSSCTATAICDRDHSHTITETVDSTFVTTEEATCTEPGVKTYSVDFTNEAFEDQTMPVVIPALGHNWGAPTYEWTQDGEDWKCTASRVCANNASHVETETVIAAHETTTDATCEGTGTETYTAEFTNTAFATQTKEIEIAATGHAWGAPTYNWEQDGEDWKCTATRVCANDASHVDTETVTATHETTTDATCEGTG
ncbi:MAG: hypothetical protein J5778_03845, partial [Clostridiales bacterium]|nr:hypothetical protein [Clostridiales bacterium]